MTGSPIRRVVDHVVGGLPVRHRHSVTQLARLAVSRGELARGAPLPVVLQGVWQGFLPDELKEYGVTASHQLRWYVSEICRTLVHQAIVAPDYPALHDKLLFHTHMPELKDVLCPLYGAVIRGSFTPFALTGAGARGVDGLLSLLARDELVIKPARGGSRKGILYVSGTPEHPSVWGSPATPEAIARSVSSYEYAIVTGYARQAAVLECIAPGFSNYMRMLTIEEPEGSATLVGATQSLSTSRAGVLSNLGPGRLLAPVELATGRLKGGLLWTEQGHVRRIARHPDTGASIGSSEMPHFSDAAVAVTAAAAALPGVGLVSWDVVLTDDGPRVIEGERVFSVREYQVDEPLLRNPLVRRFVARHGVDVRVPANDV